MNAKVIRFPTCADLRKAHAMATKRGWFERLFKPAPKRASRASLIIARAMRPTK
jgi:hypothetical protein